MEDARAGVEGRAVGNLIDLVVYGEHSRLDVEIAVNAHRRVVLFHSLPWRAPILRLEMDEVSGSIAVVAEGLLRRNLGMRLGDSVVQRAREADEVLVIQLDENNEVVDGSRVPLLVQ